jgi:hypothetical protein
MNRRTTAAIACGLIVSLFGIGALAQTFITPTPTPPTDATTKPPLGMITGGDIGFMPVHPMIHRGRKVVGKIMVRINGEWLEVEAPATIVR